MDPSRLCALWPAVLLLPAFTSSLPALKIFPPETTPANVTDSDAQIKILQTDKVKRIGRNGWDPLFTLQFRGLAELLRRPSHCTDCVCGVNQREERIVGGRIAKVNSYPWLAALMYRQKFYCGATLISTDRVLTAAHCVHGVPKDQITLVFGEHDRNMTEESETQYRKIMFIERHEFFNRANFNNDIAILTLDRPLRYNKHIGPACLPFGDDFSDEDFAEQRGFVAGWGRTQEKGKPSHILREVSVPIMTNEDCVETNYSEREITDHMMCAGYADGKRDACQGDSGGPLNWEDTRDDSDTEGTMFVIGIVSWGQGCARPNFPGVYTRITKYVDWIRDKTRDTCLCSPIT